MKPPVNHAYWREREQRPPALVCFILNGGFTFFYKDDPKYRAQIDREVQRMIRRATTGKPD